MYWVTVALNQLHCNGTEKIIQSFMHDSAYLLSTCYVSEAFIFPFLFVTSTLSWLQGYYNVKRCVTPRSRVSFRKVVVIQLVNKFLDFNGTLQFVTETRTLKQRSLSRARWIHFIPSHSTPQRLILTFNCHLHLRPLSGPFPGIQTKNLHALFIFLLRDTCFTHLNLSDILDKM